METIESLTIVTGLNVQCQSHKYSYMVLCSGARNEDYCGSSGRSLPAGQSGGGPAWPQTQGLDRGRAAARSRSSAQDPSKSEPDRVDEARTGRDRFRQLRSRVKSRTP